VSTSRYTGSGKWVIKAVPLIEDVDPREYKATRGENRFFYDQTLRMGKVKKAGGKEKRKRKANKDGPKRGKSAYVFFC